MALVQVGEKKLLNTQLKHCLCGQATHKLQTLQKSLIIMYPFHYRMQQIITNIFYKPLGLYKLVCIVLKVFIVITTREISSC